MPELAVNPDLQRYDADDAIFFARELEHVKARTYDKKYPQFNARRLFPVSMDADPADDTITYRQYDEIGTWIIVSAYGRDLPRVDVKGKEFTSVVKRIANAYGYTHDEIQKSRKLNRPLDTKRATAARRVIEQGLNDIAWNGHAKSGLPGLLTNVNIPSGNAPNGAGGNSEWSTKTPDEILADLNNIVIDVTDDTNDVEFVDTIVIPPAQYGIISSTARSANSDTTILEYFLRNSDTVTSVEKAHELKGAGTGGADIMIAYRKDEEVLTIEIPEDINQHPERQVAAFEWEVPVTAKTGGVLVYYPLAINIYEGI